MWFVWVLIVYWALSAICNFIVGVSGNSYEVGPISAMFAFTVQLLFIIGAVAYLL